LIWRYFDGSYRCFSNQGLLTSPVSDPFSIVPGSSHADLLMRLMILPVVSMIRTRWPYSCVSVVADDLQISRHGKSATVQKYMCDVVDAVFPLMEQQLLLPLSRPKKALVANLGSVSHAIARKRPPLLRRAIYKTVRNLGIDYSAGAARITGYAVLASTRSSVVLVVLPF
jgi:hypothetical protein